MLPTSADALWSVADVARRSMRPRATRTASRSVRARSRPDVAGGSCLEAREPVVERENAFGRDGPPADGLLS